ncbi:MAG: cation diffusion facilitator family transporter [Clostridia bacterium]|nr:cation diffusion facilitator family transporter [Clostridia bacterium]
MAKDIREKQITKTGFIGIIVNVLLAGFKATVGLFANAVSVILDAVNNLTDAISSIVTIVGVKLAKKKPTKNHPYGYGRIEYFSAIIVAAIVLFAGITAISESIKKIITPEQADYTAITMIIIGVAVLVKIFLGLYVKKQGKTYNSEALKASGSDALFDAIVSSATLVGGAVSLIFGITIEGYVGTVISLFIIKAGIEMLLESVGKVLGSRVDSEVTVEMKNTIREIPEVSGVYDLVLHNYGPDYAIGSVHVEVDSTLNAEEIYRVTQNIQAAVLEKFKVFLTVGIYPFDKKFTEQRRKLEEIALSHVGVKELHGFFVDESKKTFSTDVVADFTVKDRQALCEALKSEFEEVLSGYAINVNFDADYSD